MAQRLSYFFQSLRVRLLALVVLAIAPALVLVVYSAWEDRRQQRNETLQDTLRLTELVAKEEQQVIAATRQLLMTLAGLPEIRGGNPAECQVLLNRLTRDLKRYANLGLAKPDGEVVCSAAPLPGLVNIADREYFQTAFRRLDFALGDFQVGRITQRPTVNFGYPVLDAQGRAQGVVFAALDLQWFHEHEAHVQSLLPLGASLTKIDDKGIVLVHVPEAEPWIGQRLPEAILLRTVLDQGQGLQEERDTNRVLRVYAFASVASPLHTGRISVILGLPRAILFAEINRHLARHLAWLGLGAVVALVCAWFGADPLLLRHFRELAGSAQRLAGGDLSARAQVSGGPAELNELESTFNQMAKALELRDQERREAESALRESQQRLDFLMRATPAVIYSCEAKDDFACTFISANVRAQLGYEPREFTENPSFWADQIHPEDKPRVLADLVGLGETGQHVHEYRFRHKDGTWRWMHDELRLIHDPQGQPKEIVGFWADVTAWREAQEALRQLSARLLRLQDEERRRLAREMHDTTVQSLAALAMNLSLVSTLAPDLSGRAKQHLADCITLAESCTNELRTMAYLVHPPLLEELGLAEAVREYADGFAQRSGLRVDLEISDDLDGLSQDVELALFRVLQESLANILRHSGSRTASIQLTRTPAEVRLEVRDAGRGMAAPAMPGGGTPAPRLGVGVAGMRERLRQLGGGLETESSSSGTTVRAVVPLSEAQA